MHALTHCTHALTQPLTHSPIHAFTHCTHALHSRTLSRTALTHAVTQARCHAPTHSSSQSCTMHFTCLPIPPACSARLPHSCARRVTRCSAFICELCCLVVRQEDRQTDGRPQFYAFIVYTSVNTFISFKNGSIKQPNAVLHCGTFTVFWNNPSRSE